MKFLLIKFSFSRLRHSNIHSMLVGLTLLIGAQGLHAQTAVSLTDFSFFQPPPAGTSWKIVGDAKADFTKKADLSISPGTGVLANLTSFTNTGHDLVSTMKHGDADVELDYMMALGSNSGIYLQGRYEVQLLDSWGVVNPKAGDNGGIYERWNEAKPEGQKGYEGYAPRQNASRAPGLWQHIKISFQAPRFDAAGNKIENAKFLSVYLNGFLIQENVELSGVTRGALDNREMATGPLRFQGDHGPVAFRNIKVSTYDKPRPELLDLKYTVYKGKFEKEPDYKTLPPEAQGTTTILSSNVSNLKNEFIIRYTGTLRVKEAGQYNFNLSAPGGTGSMTINNQVLTTGNPSRYGGRITLPAGDLPFTLNYSKVFDWAKPALGLAVAGPGIREYVISDANVESGQPVDPILVNAPVNTILRSFMDVDNVRVTHAINVGSPQRLHYTYDMDHGMIVQAWRGGFLDATPMWHERGDGSSRPSGSLLKLGQPAMGLLQLNPSDRQWTADTTGTGFKPKGYILDASDQPTFRYQLYNATVTDVIRVLDNNQGLRRQLTVQNAAPDLYIRLAQATTIEEASGGVYLVDDKTYYLRLDGAENGKAIIRNVNGKKELIVPVQSKISYSILF